MAVSQLLEIVPLMTIVGSTSAAWGGALVAINGTKARVAKLEAHQTNVIDRLARLETKIDILLKEKS